MKITRLIIAFLLIAISFGAALAQESARDRGVAFYNLGETDRSIPLLEEASRAPGANTDAELWSFLGLAYLKKQETKKGRLALEKAVKLSSGNLSYRSYLAYAFLLDKQEKKARAEAGKVISLDPKNIWAYYVRSRANLNSSNYDEAIADTEKILAIDANNSQAYTVKSDAIFGKFILRVKKGSPLSGEREFLRLAGEPLRECLRSCRNNSDAKIQEEKLEIIEAFDDAAVRPARPIVPAEEPAGPDNTRLKILSKPRASYTDDARKNNIRGSIKVMILFAANGTISYIIPITRLGKGLDEEVAHAAALIKFTPATKRGRPVPAVATIEYHFEIY